MKIPLEKFIRCELASHGYDKDHQWGGFDKAKEIPTTLREGISFLGRVSQPEKYTLY